MTNIIIASHGPLATAIKETAELICGLTEGIETFCLNATDDSEEFYKKIKATLKKDQATLLLVDLPGGTPSNKGLILKQEYPLLRVVAGVNVMMLIECLIQKENMGIDELIERIMNSGVESIKEMELKQIEIDDIDDL